MIGIPARAPSGARILNVDDAPSKRYLKTRLLAKAGFDVVEASCAQEAQAALARQKPDLVLLDVRLPDADGRDVCAAIKGSRETADVVVLQISAALTEAGDRVRALDAGADGYLVEPVEDDELVAHVRALLRLRQAEHERQAALVALSEADRRKDEFLAMLAHELRNPLAPIANAVDILRADDAALRERARTIIARQVKHLTRLVDDLLEVSRITQRKMALKRSAVPLGSVLDAALETARPAIHARDQRLEVEVDDRYRVVDLDPVRMAQVLSNLLDNASKFSPRGSRIRLEARTRGGTLDLSVADEGIGIAPEVLPHVFDLFIQDERAIDRSQGGLGIGLSLVRGLVALHGGTVRAESAGRAHGARFTVAIPLRSGRRTLALEAEAAPMPQACRILVVEDNRDAAEALCMLLESFGHEVTVAHTGEAALSVARQARPQVVLVDIGLPGMDGHELARRLRLVPEARDARFIAVTGYGQERDRDRAARAGFDLHLTKPVDAAELADAIALAAPCMPQDTRAH